MAHERPQEYLWLISQVFYIPSSNGSPVLAIKLKGKYCIYIYFALSPCYYFTLYRNIACTTKMSQTVTHLTCIKKKPSSNRGRVTDHQDCCVSWFYSVPHCR